MFIFKFVVNCKILHIRGFSRVPNTIPALKRWRKVYFIILDLVFFTHCASWGHFQPSGRESSVSTDWMQHAAIQSGCARTVAFKLDTVYSDSPSSLYSFCIYGMLGFFSACSPGLVYLRPSNPAVPGQSFSSWIQHCPRSFLRSLWPRPQNLPFPAMRSANFYYQI